MEADPFVLLDHNLKHGDSAVSESSIETTQISGNPSSQTTAENGFAQSANYDPPTPTLDPNDSSFTFSEEDLIPLAPSWTEDEPFQTSDDTILPREKRHTRYAESGKLPFETKITVSRTILVSEQPKLKISHGYSPSFSSSTGNLRKSRGLSRTFSSFGRRQKTLASISGSPEQDDVRTPELVPRSRASHESQDASDARAESNHVRHDMNRHVSAAEFLAEDGPTGSRQGSPSSSISRLPNSDVTGSEKPALPSATRPALNLQWSFPNTVIPSLAALKRLAPEISTAPATTRVESFQLRSPSPFKRKDDLWSVFRTLDGDFQRFQAKPAALKADLVRNTLLPFLRMYASHPSNKFLRAEDLDRRVNILNKWWTGLLDMLKGANQHSISSTDRPSILDSISGIMERPEWRLPPSQFCPISERITASELATSHVTSTGDSNFLIASVHHSMRNMFTQNLTLQMEFVVDKMSSRHTPPSVVTFCGKACAYAFMFCPGVADILVRLWDIKTSSLKRIMKQYDTPSTAGYQELSKLVLLGFPQCLHTLTFSSLKDMAQKIRRKPMMPPAVQNIQWHGSWLTRWCGKESALFYVFVKYFHHLVADFLPPNTPKTQRACTPGLLLVQAQILANIDLSIRRHGNHFPPDIGTDSASVTFEDLLGPEAVTPALPSHQTNASRLMSDNRLIAILQDFVVERATPYSWSCHLFADGFCEVLKAAVATTSLYNYNACFMICDFLQEALVALTKIERHTAREVPFLDRGFLLNVFNQMVKSENTMIDIRLYALLFHVWNTINEDQSWKNHLCLQFLLEERFFESRFSHWCPMVRAYYMRLLCWRVGRFDGDASAAEILILETLLLRVRSVWSHHKYVAQAAETHGQPPPSTAPCNPAPGRRLLIIRTDNPITSTLLSLSTAVSSTSKSSEATNHSRPASLSSTVELGGINPAQLLERLSLGFDETVSMSKRNPFIRTLLRPREDRGLGQQGTASPKVSSRDSSRHGSSQNSRDSSRRTSPERQTDDSRSSFYEHRPPWPNAEQNLRDSKPSAGASTAQPLLNQPKRTQASFKFSLEIMDRRPQTMPPMTKLYPPRLPLAAQLLLESRPAYTPDLPAVQPVGDPVSSSRYAGRALAEWSLVVNECQNFFERRRNEGVPSNKLVETPTLGIESFRRPG